MKVGQVKIGDFCQITRYNSKTVQDRRIVSTKVDKEVVCALLNGDTAGDLVTPNSPNRQNSTVYVAFHIFAVSQRKDFKFGVQVDHSKSQPTDDKLFLKGA